LLSENVTEQDCPLTVPVNWTAPVVLLLKTLTATVSPGVEDAEDWDRVPPFWLTFTVSAAVQLTPDRVMVNVSVPVPVAVPWLVSTSRLDEVVSVSPIVVDVNLGEAKASPLGALKVSVLPCPEPLATPLTTAPDVDEELG
jgi:hypothetical protein